MNLEIQSRKLSLMRQAPRCSATSKRSGQPCKAPAVRGYRVCRCHGARGGAPKGEAHGNWKHGRWTNEAVGNRAYIQALLRDARALTRQMT
jgi:hypothetical protein